MTLKITSSTVIILGTDHGDFMLCSQYFQYQITKKKNIKNKQTVNTFKKLKDRMREYAPQKFL